MATYWDKLIFDCDSFGACSKKCEHFNDCLSKHKLGGVNNNPSTLSGEISNFEDVYDDKPNSPDNFNVNICEVPGLLINKAIISQFNSNEDIEIKNIISAALNKFVIENTTKYPSSIIKYDKMKYHFVFNCSDCNSLNDFVDYSVDDEIFFYCRYCGKQHKFDLKQAIDKSNNTMREPTREEYESVQTSIKNNSISTGLNFYEVDKYVSSNKDR